MGCASVAYKLRAVAVRSSFSQNLQAKAPVYILRSLTSEALEYQQTIDIESTWPGKLMYAIVLPHKAWAAGDTLTAIVKLSPLAKGVYVQAIDSLIVETTKINTRGGNREDTRVVASSRREMIMDHKAAAVEVEVVTSPNSSATATTSSSSSGALGTLAAHSLRSSRPASPHLGSSSSYHPPTPAQQREEDIESNDIVTYINLSIPRSTAYPFLYSASDTASPITTPRSSATSSPTLQHTLSPLSTTSQSTINPTSPNSPSTVTPSHNLEPIFITHRIKWIIFIHNKDGHVSELRCSLPIRILDGALLEESRGFTMRFRRLLLRTSGLGGVLSRSGEEDIEGNEGDEEEGRVRQMEVDRELPSYPAHVRDRVANMFLSDAVTMLVSNPWVGKIGPSGPASGSGASALNTPESSGQLESSSILSPSTPVGSPSDSASESATLHTQPDYRASRSGYSTPDVQSSQQQTYTGNLLVNEAVRRIGDVPSSGSGQQQQSQPHQHRHKTDDLQQHSGTLRWGNRVGSRGGSRVASPERTAVSPVTTNTTNNSDNNPGSISEGGVYGSSNSVVSSSSSPGPGSASPFQNLFKATIKPLTALAGHRGHGHHSHRPTHSLSRSTTSLTGLRSSSSSTAGTASDLSAGATTNSNQTSELMRSELYLSLSYSSMGSTNQMFSSSPSTSPQNETNGFKPDCPSSTSLAAANGTTAPSMSSSTDSSGLGSVSSSLTTSTSATTSPLSHTISRAFSLVPDYSIASRGFIGGIPPLSSMRGLPSYEEAEAQQKKREAAETVQSPALQTRLPAQNQGQTLMQMHIQNQVEEKTKMKMKERGSMSEPDLVGRFGHIGVCFEPGTQAVTETEAEVGSSQSGTSTSGSVGILQRLHDGEDEDDDGDEDDFDAGQIQMRIKVTERA